MSEKQMVNAWIFLNEDEPSGTNYNSPNSSYQRLIQEHVYDAVDLLYLCFFEIVPTGPDTVPSGDGSSYTLRVGESSHPGGLTNQDYMDFILRDARAQKPDVKIGATLVWGNGPEISQIFSDPQNPDKTSAEKFASNLMKYLEHYGLNAFDLDWEPPLSSATTRQQFQLLVDAIGAQFGAQKTKFYLTLSPASSEHINANAINENVDFINMQLYFSNRVPVWYEEAGVDSDLFAYGAKFESNYQTAQQAYDDNRKNFGYSIFTVWRLNSGNYEFEQDQQKDLHQLVFGSPSS